MHSHDLRPFMHSHAFGDADAPVRERALWWVTWITLATMALETELEVARKALRDYRDALSELGK